ISMEDPDDSCPEEIPGVKEALKNNDTAGAAKRIKEYLEKQTNVSLNIAITGESGAGKSTFINAFRGIKNRDEGAAPTGVTETTSEVTPYPHPDNPNVTLWDLPGIGTKDFPARKYLKLVGFDKYDFFLIISDTRFRENDVKLAQKIKKMKENFYFVRSKIDNDIQAEESVSDSSKEKTLTKIRDDCIQRLKDLGIESPRVFLMSSFQLHKFDFSLLQETLERELPKDKRDTLLYVMPNVNPDVISKKKKALKVHLYLLATLSAAAAAVPVPGLSVAVDVAVLIGAVTHFVHAFGLDVQSLKKLAIRTAVSYTELRDVIISPVAAKEITKELFLKVFAQLGGAAGLIGAEEVSRFIPIVGIPVAMSLSFVTTYRVLNFILNQLAEDAQKVLKKALV
uniref:IRG-type G domain-containing protein n=3 Tax=Oreochromis TaxID=8139 RepID=A0A669DKT7_ORENI